MRLLLQTFKMKVAVGSTNPVKIKAAEDAFNLLWSKKKWTVVGVKVPLGVSNQPMSDAESIKGATTRAQGYRDGLIMALARYLHSELWE